MLMETVIGKKSLVVVVFISNLNCFYVHATACKGLADSKYSPGKEFSSNMTISHGCRGVRQVPHVSR